MIEVNSFTLWGFDIGTFIPTFISLCAVIIGWGVIYRNAKKLASRNEVHTFSTSINVTLKEIESLSEDFWFKSIYNNSPASYEMLVISKIKIVQSKLNFFSKNRISVKDADELIFKLRSSCTKDSSEISGLTHAEKRACMNKVINALSILEFAVSTAITNKYPHT